MHSAMFVQINLTLQFPSDSDFSRVRYRKVRDLLYSQACCKGSCLNTNECPGLWITNSGVSMAGVWSVQESCVPSASIYGLLEDDCDNTLNV